jgi:hypothetical protein
MEAARTLPLGDLKGVEALIQAGELCVAFEIRCEQIHEYDVRLPLYLRGLLAEPGEQMGVASHYWELLDLWVATSKLRDGDERD